MLHIGYTGEISFTFDGWTSLVGVPYLTFTVHYIDINTQDSTNWTLRAHILRFPKVNSSHSGANTAVTLMRVIDKYELHSKVYLVMLVCFYSHLHSLSSDMVLQIMSPQTIHACVR